MYHRYQPDGNGQFTRRTVGPVQPPERPTPQSHRPPEPPPPPKPPVQGERLHGLPLPLPFLERLLPDMDNGDLLLLLILMLLLTEGTQDATSAAMTIAIFLFMQ